MRAHASLVAVVAVVLAAFAVTEGAVAAAPPLQARPRPPTFAYYYIWFTGDSWRRAKSDQPAIGRYSSDSPEVMREHIRWAKAAGISAFLVSWKSTETLNRRLDLLVEEARAQDFKLGIVYQALDFDRDPIPVEQISADLQAFSDRWGDDPVFDVFGAPLVIVAGTWQFSADDMALLSGQFRAAHVRDAEDGGQARGLLLLASERDPDAYLRLSGLVDGNAYYWSSADPARQRSHTERLQAMREAVGDGIWIAPAAPGFNATLLGGTRIIDRLEGRTFEQQLNAALDSNPEAIGVISWNEFSENTHIEPSTLLGTRALEVLAAFAGGQAPTSIPKLKGLLESPTSVGSSHDDGDSSASPGISNGLAAVAALLLVVGISALAIGYRLGGRRPARGAE